VRVADEGKVRTGGPSGPLPFGAGQVFRRNRIVCPMCGEPADLRLTRPERNQREYQCRDLGCRERLASVTGNRFFKVPVV
jgi:hypothetical protein